jgi:hypothetical protein
MRCWVVRDLDSEEIALQVIDVLEFEVVGPDWGPGLVSVEPEVRVTRDEDAS